PVLVPLPAVKLLKAPLKVMSLYVPTPSEPLQPSPALSVMFKVTVPLEVGHTSALVTAITSDLLPTEGVPLPAVPTWKSRTAPVFKVKPPVVFKVPTRLPLLLRPGAKCPGAVPVLPVTAPAAVPTPPKVGDPVAGLLPP